MGSAIIESGDGLIKQSWGVLHLIKYEQMAEAGIEKIKAGANELALALHHLHNDGLWLHAKDEDGLPYQKWEDYLKHLADRYGIKRTSAFDYKGVVKFALANGYASDDDDFIHKGGVYFFRRIKAPAVVNRATGEITGLRESQATPEEAKAAIGELVNTVDKALPPKEQVTLIRETLLPPGQDLVEIRFGIVRNGKGANIRYTKYVGVRHIEEGFLDQKAPDDVLELLAEKLHILEEEL